jgi:hypothetical protein
MVIDDLRRDIDGEMYEISARLRPADADADPFRIWFRFPAQFAPEGELDASPFLPHALPWCLRRGEPLTIEGPVSVRLLDAVGEIMRVYGSFFPGSMRHPVRVEAEPRVPGLGRDLTASLFTRGIDSWFAVLSAMEDPQLRPPISHVVYLPAGPEHWTSERRDARVDGIRRAAARVGLDLIRLDSNIKEHFGRGQFSMALVLGFKNVLLPSDDMRAGLRAKGLHPFLDPRFSTERTELHHYGDASRWQKTERVARLPAALETLAVCKYDDLEADRNCGRCEKCLRTMLALHAVGALDRCPVFDQPLEVSSLAAIKDVSGSRQDWLDALHGLGDGDFDRRLAAAAHMVILRSDIGSVARRASRLAGRRRVGQELGDPELLTEPAGALRAVDHELDLRMGALGGQGNGAGGEAPRRPRLLRRLLSGS